MTIPLNNETMKNMRVSHALRWVPRARMATFLPCSVFPQAGDIVLAKLEKIGQPHDELGIGCPSCRN